MYGYNQGMKKFAALKILFGIILALTGMMCLAWQGSVQAAPQAQLTSFPTPTPGSDGRIVYIIQPGDTLWRIAAITGISLPDLRDLNHLAADDVVIPGQKIFLGLGGPSEEEANMIPTSSPTPSAPTETPKPGFGTLCVLLFNDENGDAIRQEEEASLPGGAINISNRDGSVSITEDTTDGFEYSCTDNLEEGTYNVSAGIPEGYNSTMVLNISLDLVGGDTSYINFGAQANSETIEENIPIIEDTSKSPILGLIGAALLLSGIGIGVYSVWLKN